MLLYEYKMTDLQPIQFGFIMQYAMICQLNGEIVDSAPIISSGPIDLDSLFSEKGC